MNTTDFNYYLPDELIAQEPAQERDASRLLVVDRSSETFEDHSFSAFPSFLHPDDLLVFNNTKVIPARVFGTKESGGRVEFLFLEEVGKGIWKVLMRASRRPAVGASIRLDEDVSVKILEDGELGEAIVEFSGTSSALDTMEKLGETPLPPYIRRREPRPADKIRYQTLWAREPGAVAAPTAGLHFSEAILKEIDHAGVARTEVTLHVGVGTFRPVSVDRVEDHRMDEERYEVGADAVTAVRSLRQGAGRLIAIGSTSVRTLETTADEGGCIREGAGRTDLFIYPPYAFKVIDAILTNFHLPQSTLLMMMSAFAGRELIMEAYAHAVREKYRFYSYGDCMLIV